MTLFDDYPPHQPIRRTGPCCEGQHGAPIVEQFLHVLAHSRVPFSAQALAELAGLTDHMAAAEIDVAIEAGHVGPVEPEDYMEAPTGLYVGRLARRK